MLSVTEERDLSTAYRRAETTIQPQGQGLNDLYVRFYRMAERRIVEMSGRGIVCFISNYSWLDGRSFTAMRERYLRVFDRIWIDCLNGDKYKTGKLTPDGAPDPSIFSTERNREGIQVGTAIALLVRGHPHAPTQEVNFRHLWGTGKRSQLASEAARRTTPEGYRLLTPPSAFGLPFLPLQAGDAYAGWPALPDLLPTYFPGVKTSRDDVVVDIDRDRLLDRMQRYFDPAVSHEEIRRLMPGAMRNTARFPAEATRERLQRRGFLPKRIVRYCYRPFDVRWLYWEPETDLLDRKREDYFPQVFAGNVWIEARQKQPMDRFDRGYVTRALADNFGNGLSSFFPLYLRTNGVRDLFNGDHPPEKQEPNLSVRAREYLESIGAQAEDLFYHIVAVLHAPAYRAEHAGALRQDWPRVPLPRTGEALLTSAALGRQVANLLDADEMRPGASVARAHPELRSVGVFARAGGGYLDPDAGHLAVTVGWGFVGQGGATMAGKGRLVERPYTPEERAKMLAGAETAGLGSDVLDRCLGTSTFDIYLNEIAYCANVPAHVWSYTLGGYQVLKKWLSYREQAVLGRDLLLEEALYLTAITGRIAAILLLGPRLDEAYRATAADS